jgi:hypothetical protein
MGIAYGTTTLHQATKGIVQDGLVLNLDAAVSTISGTTIYDLTGTDNGTLVNAPVFNKGKGGHFTLDGTDEYIQTNTEKADFTTDNEITISLWFEILTATNVRGLMQFGSGLASGHPWVLIRTNGGSLSWYLNGNYRINHSFTTDEIYNICISYNSSTWSAYKNATLDGTYSNTVGPNLGPDFKIGTGYNGRLNMNFYACQIYNRALTSDEVARNFNVMRHRFGI